MATQQARSNPKEMLLGSMFGIISMTTLAPIERVKLLLQCQGEMVKSGRLNAPYKGILDCTARIFRSEGILPFWRSNLVNIFTRFPSQALTFAFKDKFNSLFKLSSSDSYSTQLCKNIAIGSAAGIASITVLYSLDYTRTRLANDVIEGKTGGERQFRGIIDVYRKSFASDGLVGLYRGFVVSCFGLAVYRGLYFGLYDTVKTVFLSKDSSYMLHYFVGFGVTVTAGLAAYPFDTVHRRMLMRTAEAVKYKGSWDCFTQVVRNEGYLSLMNGAGVSIVRGVAGAGMLVCYDILKKHIL